MVHVLQSIHQKRKILHQSSFFHSGENPFHAFAQSGYYLEWKGKNLSGSIFFAEGYTCSTGTITNSNILIFDKNHKYLEIRAESLLNQKQTL